jgi:radical SAM protein with 4Fe4S-binding SPASM domain
MSETFVQIESIANFPLWEKRRAENGLCSFTLELTARCNNSCRHCYINLSENDESAKADELSLDEIKSIADQAVDLGALWCLLTGGEPLLREDFEEIYIYLKQKGLLVSVFTNATLITEKHAALFRKYPPRDIEITVYGISREIYGAVTRRPGLFPEFFRGLALLQQAGIKFTLKAVPIRESLREYNAIADFCRRFSYGPFRFDPLLHLRFDRDERKNREIMRQRLEPEQIAALERADKERRQGLEKSCGLVEGRDSIIASSYLFGCGAGLNDFVVSYDGWYRLCSSLWHTDCLYDLRRGSIKDAWENFVPKVRSMTSNRRVFLEHCDRCSLVNLCLWCPAHSFLETGYMDLPQSYFCEVAGARSNTIARG